MAQKSDPMHRIAQLEGKLNGLISTLSASHIMPIEVEVEAPRPGTDVSGQLPQPHPPPGTTRTLDSYNAALVETSSIYSGPGHFPSSSSPFHVQVPGWTDSDLPADVEECLRTFCGRMLRYFPFMQLPVDVDWMGAERPFLLVCICAASSRSTQTRLALGRRIKQTVAERLILDGHSIINIDLLLGLLTFLAWGHDALLRGTPTSLSRFAQLAMMAVFELHLNKPPAKETNMLSINGSDNNFLASGGAEHTLEERRAVLGCYYMTAVISSYLGHMDGLQWTPYMEESLAILSRSTECPSDESFAHQIRLQLLSGEVESARCLIMPPYFYIKAMQSKLEAIKGAISPHLQNDEILLASIYFAELSILEAGLSKDTLSTQRVECLCACLKTVKAAFENFFKLPPAEYPAFPFPLFTQLARYIMVLVKLSTLNDPLWDTDLVRLTIDVLHVVDQVIINIQVATDGDLRLMDGVLTRAARVFTAVKTWCGAKLAESRGDADNGYEGSQVHSGVFLNALNLSDIWMRDMLSAGSLDEQEFFS